MKRTLMMIAKYVVTTSIIIAGGFLSGTVVGAVAAGAEKAFDEVMEE